MYGWVGWSVCKPSSATALLSGPRPAGSQSLTHLFCPGAGRGKDTPASGDEDSGARSGARPALAQCRALSVDRAGPGSPRRLYLSLQVSTGGLPDHKGSSQGCVSCPLSCSAGSLQASWGKEAPREGRGPVSCVFAKLRTAHAPGSLPGRSGLLCWVISRELSRDDRSSPATPWLRCSSGKCGAFSEKLLGRRAGFRVAVYSRSDVSLWGNTCISSSRAVIQS